MCKCLLCTLSIAVVTERSLEHPWEVSLDQICLIIGSCLWDTHSVWKRTLQGRSYSDNVKRVHLLIFLMGQDIQWADQAMFKQNAKKKKITEEQFMKIYWNLIGLQSLGRGCSWIAGWWDMEGVLGKAQLVFYFLCYFCKHLLLDTVGQRKRQASNLIFISLTDAFTKLWADTD